MEQQASHFERLRGFLVVWELEDEDTVGEPCIERAAFPMVVANAVASNASQRVQSCHGIEDLSKISL